MGKPVRARKATQVYDPEKDGANDSTRLGVTRKVLKKTKASQPNQTSKKAATAKKPTSKQSAKAKSAGGSSKKRKKVMVSGCYDLLHTGHVAFFKEASQLGDLYVSVGSDACVTMLKKKPMFPEDERVYMVQAIRYVTEAFVCPGMGDLDWVEALDTVKPDLFFVNEDGDRPGKREACEAKGVKYIVAKRKPDAGLIARSSTDIKNMLKK